MFNKYGYGTIIVDTEKNETTHVSRNFYTVYRNIPIAIYKFSNYDDYFEMKDFLKNHDMKMYDDYSTFRSMFIFHTEEAVFLARLLKNITIINDDKLQIFK